MSETTTGKVNFSPAELGKNFTKWRKELLLTPAFKFRDAFGPLFKIVSGVRYKESVGSLEGNMQIGPYDPFRVDQDGVNISTRTLEVFLGSVVKEIDPNTAIQSIWDEYVAVGAGGKNIPFVKFVAAYLMNKVSENLYLHVWDGVRNDKGTKTKDLCDGIETIIKKEIKNTAISTENKNLFTIEEIDGTNAEDILKDFYWSADKKLRAGKTFLCLSDDEYRHYCDCYQANHGALPYNIGYDKTFLEGTQGKCQLKVVDNVTANFLKLVPAGNFMFGTNINGEESRMLIEESKRSHFLYDLVVTMFAGYQIERIEKEFLHVGLTSSAITAAKQ